MDNPRSVLPKQHLLTVLLEDYFQTGVFDETVQRKQWYRFEQRFEQNTYKALDLLDMFNIKATFFVLGWIADRYPEIVRAVQSRGHEIASRGYYQRNIIQMPASELREDLVRSREALERASGSKILGYRSSQRWFAPDDLWVLPYLAEEGYAYDSSFVITSRAFRAAPHRRFAHRLTFGEKELWEFPLPSYNFLGWLMPIAGGNYFRQFPHPLVKRAIEHWHGAYDAPFIMYFHIWELDTEQPRISAASRLGKIRQYRNLDKMPRFLEEYFKTYSFVGIAKYLGLSTVQETIQESGAKPASEVYPRDELHLAVQEAQKPTRINTSSGRTPVSIVVPCFNEKLALPYLSNTLKSVISSLEEHYELRFIFVDDGSTDGTWDCLKQHFGMRPECTFLLHKHNRGVAATILDGIRHANTEIVCSIDCDCTYDPHELREMIPQLADGIDMVTASPYHPQGEVRNVPSWRLALSKTSSFLYRQVLRQKLFTYTSCFRVYRRSTVINLHLKEEGFLGVAEMLGKMDLCGSKIVEHPSTLEVRLFGYSKMKILKTIAGHFKLLTRLLALRIHPGGGAFHNKFLGDDLMSVRSLGSEYQTTPFVSQKERT
ncbi:hypothetical protein BH18ACI4_BH18ACI4_13350 [soil metagenome]